MRAYTAKGPQPRTLAAEGAGGGSERFGSLTPLLCYVQGGHYAARIQGSKPPGGSFGSEEAGELVSSGFVPVREQPAAAALCQPSMGACHDQQQQQQHRAGCICRIYGPCR